MYKTVENIKTAIAFLRSSWTGYRHKSWIENIGEGKLAYDETFNLEACLAGWLVY